MGFVEVLMVSNGLVSLLGWNAILSSLDYFHDDYKRDVYIEYTLYFMGLYNVVGYLMPCIAKAVSYPPRLLGSMFMMNVLMVGLLLVGLLHLSYVISVLLVLLIAVANMILQSSLYGLLNFYSPSQITLFTTGTGASGVVVTLLRLLAMGIF
jgi:hypothetical protein